MTCAYDVVILMTSFIDAIVINVLLGQVSSYCGTPYPKIVMFLSLRNIIHRCIRDREQTTFSDININLLFTTSETSISLRNKFTLSHAHTCTKHNHSCT